MDAMIERTCIVTRRSEEPDQLIRFVTGPDLQVVPDLKHKLPGRGCWVTAQRLYVDRAARQNLFRRALKCDVSVPDDLGSMVDHLLCRSALGALGLARKAGALVLGAAKVEAAIRAGKAIAVLHAHEAAPDGIGKISQARRVSARSGGPRIPAYKLFPLAELGLAFGGTNVIHAAVLDADAGKAAHRRVMALDRYRGGSPDDRLEIPGTDEQGAAEDTE